MLALGSLAFASPWILAALAALPVIWWLLRVTPPAPRQIVFPAIRLLLGLVPREETPARTPWWLILLRTVIAALIVVARADPSRRCARRGRGAGAEAVARRSAGGACPASCDAVAARQRVGVAQRRCRGRRRE